MTFSDLPDSSGVALDMDHIEMSDSGIANRFTCLCLKVIQVTTTGECVDCQNLDHKFNRKYSRLNISLNKKKMYQFVMMCFDLV